MKCIHEADDEYVEYRIPEEENVISWPAFCASSFLEQQVNEILHNKSIVTNENDKVTFTIAVWCYSLQLVNRFLIISVKIKSETLKLLLVAVLFRIIC